MKHCWKTEITVILCSTIKTLIWFNSHSISLKICSYWINRQTNMIKLFHIVFCGLKICGQSIFWSICNETALKTKLILCFELDFILKKIKSLEWIKQNNNVATFSENECNQFFYEMYCISIHLKLQEFAL